MADIFDVNQYKSENSRLTLTPDQKRMITAEMYQACHAMKKNNKKTFWTKGIAAALVIALVGTVTYFGFGNSNKSDNWFSIKASAASATQDEVNRSAIGDEVNQTFNNELTTNGHSMGAMSGFFMEDGEEPLTKDGYKDYFALYHMEDFSVTGANIKAVKVESNTNGIYFTLTPSDKTVDFYSDTASIDDALMDYKERYTIDYSQYTFDELREHAPYLLWPCDGFVYDNKTVSTGEETNILPNYSIDIILESDHSDSEIAAWTKEIGEIKDLNRPSGREKYEPLEEKIQKKMLENARISVTVTYEDNSTETQVIDLVYIENRFITFDIKN